MFADIAVAGRSYGGVRVVGLLHHGAEQAGELRQLALKDRLAKIDVAKHPVARVGEKCATASSALKSNQRQGVIFWSVIGRVSLRREARGFRAAPRNSA
ncbi:MAG TPA: hypothetical protein VFE60_22455 [Roseiarcus sp.]|nr:hypothetical protein [Roseiarcus sp.]